MSEAQVIRDDDGMYEVVHAHGKLAERSTGLTLREAILETLHGLCTDVGADPVAVMGTTLDRELVMKLSVTGEEVVVGFPSVESANEWGNRVLMGRDV